MAEKQPIWDRDVQQAGVSYLKEMVSSPASIYGGLGSLALAALLSIPLGLGVGALPIIGYAAAQGIAALFVPSSPVFRDKVDRRKRAERREQARRHLLEEIGRRVNDNHGHWAVYERMCQRLASLREIARDRKTALSEHDLEKLDDATVDYLGRWLAQLVIAERQASLSDKALQQRIEAIDRQIERTESEADAARLAQARTELARVSERRQALWARSASLEAGMVSMADAFEELYQQIVANPASSDISTHLQEAVERMHTEEELDLAVESEVSDLLRQRRAARRAQKA